MASHKGVVSHEVLCAGGHSTKGSFFREVAVSGAPQEGEIEVVGGLFVSLLLREST